MIFNLTLHRIMTNQTVNKWSYLLTSAIIKVLQHLPLPLPSLHTHLRLGRSKLACFTHSYNLLFTPRITLLEISYGSLTFLKINISLCYSVIIQDSTDDRIFKIGPLVFVFINYKQTYKSFIFILLRESKCTHPNSFTFRFRFVTILVFVLKQNQHVSLMLCYVCDSEFKS